MRFIALLLFTAAILASSLFAQTQTSAPTQAPAASTITQQPTFAKNVGQLPEDVTFSTNTPLMSILGQKTGLAFRVREVVGARDLYTSVQMDFEGANPDAEVIFDGPVVARENHFRGSAPDGFVINVPCHQKVIYKSLYPNVDFEFYYGISGFEYDIRCSTAEDLQAVVFRVRGARSVRLNESGSMEFATAGGAFVKTLPKAYLFSDDGQSLHDARFISIDGGRFGIQARSGPSERKTENRGMNSSLVIDPTIHYSTFLGKNTWLSYQHDVTIANSGDTWISGMTTVIAFPTTPGSWDTTFNGNGSFGGDFFLMRLSSDGTSLPFSTFIGGSNDESYMQISLDAESNVYLAGHTKSTNFPITSGAPSTPGGGIIICKLNSTGSSLLFSRFLTAGVQFLLEPGVACGNGFVAISGTTTMQSPFTNPGSLQPMFGGGQTDIFAAKINSNNGDPIFITYFGGPETDQCNTVACDSTGGVWICGLSATVSLVPINSSSIFPNGGGSFLLCFTGDGSGVSYGTFHVVTALRSQLIVSPSGIVSMAGMLGSVPLVAGSYLNNPMASPCVVKFHYPTSTILAASYINPDGKVANRLAFDAVGNAFQLNIAQQGSPPQIVTPNALKPIQQDRDGHIAMLNSTGTGLLYASYVGGNSWDDFYAVAGAPDDGCVVVGIVKTQNYPVSLNAYDSSLSANEFKLCATRFKLPYTAEGTQSFANGTTGCPGTQQLSTNKIAKPGADNYQWICSNAPPNSLGIVFVSEARNTGFPDPLGITVPILVDLFHPNMFALDMLSDVSGMARTAPIVIPNNTGLAGMTFYSQAFWQWNSPGCVMTSPYQISASDGLSVTVQS